MGFNSAFKVLNQELQKRHCIVGMLESIRNFLKMWLWHIFATYFSTVRK